MSENQLNTEIIERLGMKMRYTDPRVVGNANQSNIEILETLRINSIKYRDSRVVGNENNSNTGILERLGMKIKNRDQREAENETQSNAEILVRRRMKLNQIKGSYRG